MTNPSDKIKIRFIDLFCGIGGFRIAVEQASSLMGVKTECVFSCDIDEACQNTYETNFGERPFGDITKIDAKNIPPYDVLLAGFPCQPFSIIGHRKGFSDTRGTLFFEIARIIEARDSGVDHMRRKYESMSEKLGTLQIQITEGLTASWNLLKREAVFSR